MFGFADAVALRVNIPYIPSELIGTIPYIVTIVVLAGFIGRATPPKAVGKPYYKGGK